MLPFATLSNAIYRCKADQPDEMSEPGISSKT
jgi:hypothetical protein